MNSCWVKLKYKTGILDRYYARIVVKGYLRKNGFDLLSPLTFSHITVWLDLEINAIFGFFTYDYDAVCTYYQHFCTRT
jgi:hypothetical protein